MISPGRTSSSDRKIVRWWFEGFLQLWLWSSSSTRWPRFRNTIISGLSRNYCSNDKSFFPRYVKADWSLDQEAFCRAYINFKDHQDVYLFQDKFDGYVFVDSKGNEFEAVVEFAPNQKISGVKEGRRKDAKMGTIEQDADYVKFLEALQGEELGELEGMS